MNRIQCLLPMHFRPFLMKNRRLLAASLLCLFCSTVAIAGVWAAFQTATQPIPQLAAMLPQGALLTIEAKDFAGLLKHWDDSPEKSAWLKSDNYGVFSRSRLFGRLGDAQGEFARAAGLPPDISFLTEVAGTRSIFAWYDIGNLQFLYITQLPSGAAEKTRLMQMRGKFSTRQIGSQTFYVRTQPDPSQPDPEAQGGQPRTVAFATSGDWLLLATREDLMADALTLIDEKISSAKTSSPLTSVSMEPWFTDAQAAAGKDPGELRMTLNLEKIVPTPYFRSYWVQRNITEMKQFRSAVADLHIETGSFREERVLLPKSTPPATKPDTSQDSNPEANSIPDLAALTALLPPRVGVYRAVAAPTVDAALASLNEKLIQRGVGAFSDPRLAPDASTSVPEAGTAGDLETRIDSIALASAAHTAPESELASLRQTLAAAGIESMMTVSRTNEAAAGIWIPFQSALVLSSAKDWDAAALQSALLQATQAHLTAGGLGLEWKPVKTKQGTYFEMSEARPLQLAVNGKLCLLTDDPGLMLEMLGHLSTATTPNRESIRKFGSQPGAKPGAAEIQAQATVLAGFNLPEERASFARWSALVDRNSFGPGEPADGSGNGPGREPAFFSKNMRSLSDTFASLQSERFVERREGALTRQTVTYAWRH
jgi:hypothetical protein